MSKQTLCCVTLCGSVDESTNVSDESVVGCLLVFVVQDVDYLVEWFMPT